MPSFVNDVNGNKPQYYLPITITNNTTLASASGFTAHLTVDSSTYSTYEATDLSNINFQDGAGNILTSWLESGFTNTSTSTVYHILMNQTIAASSNIDIYMVFYNTSAISKDNVVTGANPLYTSTYAQYDNGVNVFKQYTAFGGLSALPTGFTSWKTGTTGVTITFASTYTQISGNGSSSINGGIQYTNQTLTSPFSQVMEYSVVLPDESGTSSVTYGFGIGTTGTASSFAGGGGGICLTCESTAGATIGYLNSGTAYDLTLINGGTAITSAKTPSASGILSLYFNNSTNYYVLFSYTSFISNIVTSDISGVSLPYYVYATASTNPLTLYWVRTRQLINTLDSYSISLGIVDPAPIVITYSETETEVFVLDILNKYSETETYTLNFNSNNIFKYLELEDYTWRISSWVFRYSYSETEGYTTKAVLILNYKYQEQQYEVVSGVLPTVETSDYQGNFKPTYLLILPFNYQQYPANKSTTATVTFTPNYSNVPQTVVSDQIVVSFTFTFTSASTYTSPTVTTTITDSASTPIPNALVSWTATGSTTVSPTSATTNSSGQASTTVSTAGSTVTATTTLLGVTETSSVAT